MMKPSPQFLFSAAASVLAMAALALSAPTISTGGDVGFVGSPVMAGVEIPSLPAMPTLLPR